MSLSYATIVLEFNGEEREFEVGYDFYPASKGRREDDGTPLEPDEPARVEVGSYKLAGEDIESELTAGQLQRIEQACLEKETA